MIKLLVAFGLLHACRCPPTAFAAFGAPPSGMLVCLDAPPPGCEDITGPQCPAPRAYVGLALCRAGEVPLVDFDARGIHCAAQPSGPVGK